ncbi:hypothetical protein NMY22_g7051 [Coprinellus aureogranulatus]|nr:hypothetical protein NMY22_g7051 [Coprinellus aureogranulatus]
MAKLPFELWAQIAEYLTLAELGRVCGSNRVFFERLMDLKYRDVRMGGIADKELYLAVANPVVSRRVRSIALYTLNFKTYIMADPHHFKALLRRHSSGPSGFLKGILRPRDRDSDTSLFPALESLSISISSIYSYGAFLKRPDVLRWLGVLWRSIMKAPLTSLNLNIAIEAYRDDVVPSSLFIPTLTDLKLGIWAGYVSTDYQPYLSTKLAPLVNRHAGSLRHLSIQVQEAAFKVHPRYYDSSLLFQHLQLLPKLTSVEVKLSLLTPSPTDLSGLHDFLQAHSQQVTELTLHLLHSLLHEHPYEPSLVTPYTAADLGRLPLFNSTSMNLPILRKLDFAVFHGDLDVFPGPSDLLLGWARRHPPWSNTLKHLRLTSHYVSPANAIHILSSPQFSGVTELHLSVQALRVDFLLQVKEQLPQLKDLTLNVMHWIQKLDLAPELQGQDIAELVEEMRTSSQDCRHLFADWTLRRLAICIGRPSQADRPRQDSDRYRFLVELFPGVHTVEYADTYGVS